MQSHFPVAVIGAGPYGLSIAAHLRARDIPHVIFGEPMESWKENMPEGMFLKSPWGSASTLSEPSGFYTLDRFARTRGAGRDGPIPLKLFVDYGLWFQENAVPEVRRDTVRCLELADGGFRLSLDEGSVLRADRVVVASGIRGFAKLPVYAEGLPRQLISHTIEHQDLSTFGGRTVAVVGSGQSGLESAALLAERGASVELIVRADRVQWIGKNPWNQGLAKRVFYAPSEVGPPLLSWLIHFPRLFRKLPEHTRMRFSLRAIRPAGASWLKSRVDGRLNVTTGTTIRSATPNGDGLVLVLSDGSRRVVDHLLLGTGFEPDVSRLPFLDSELKRQIATVGGMPVLTVNFESSVQRLHFVGALGLHSFGPICRFVAGAALPARRIARVAGARR